jgi:hypothetical protein
MEPGSVPCFSKKKHGPLPNSFSMFPAKRPDPDIVFSYNLVMVVADSYIDCFSSHIVRLLVEAQTYCSLQLHRSKHHNTTHKEMSHFMQTWFLATLVRNQQRCPAILMDKVSQWWWILESPLQFAMLLPENFLKHTDLASALPLYSYKWSVCPMWTKYIIKLISESLSKQMKVEYAIQVTWKRSRLSDEGYLDKCPRWRT